MLLFFSLALESWLDRCEPCPGEKKWLPCRIRYPVHWAVSAHWMGGSAAVLAAESWHEMKNDQCCEHDSCQDHNDHQVSTDILVVLWGN